MRIDALLGSGNNLIGVPWPQIALDVKSSRIFNMRTALETTRYYPYSLFYGRVDNLLVMIPMRFEDLGATSMVLRSFLLHRDWRRIRPETDDFVFMYSGELDYLR